jgi:protocatechuate 3,4-dioxygenase beta subunit
MKRRNSIRVTRRRLLGGVGLLLAVPAGAATLALTPRQSAGPFYPNQPLLDDDNDLTRVPGRDGQASGVISDLAGRVLDQNGRAVSGARIEIWQCDANGRYRHSRDRRDVAPDPAFQGFGKTLSDAAGRYRFRTIRPVPYPGRTPHIHAAVFREGAEPFVTQIYVAGEPRNAEDFLFRRIPSEVRHLATAAFEAGPSGEAQRATFDFILAPVLAG